MASPLASFPFLLTHPYDLITLLPQEVWNVGATGQEKNSFHPITKGPEVVPVGTGMGDSRIRIALSNKGDPIKSSQGKIVKNRKIINHRGVLIILIYVILS